MLSFIRLLAVFIMMCVMYPTVYGQDFFFTPPQFPVPYVPSSYWLMGNPGIGDRAKDSNSKGSRKTSKKSATTKESVINTSTLITLSDQPTMPAKLAAKYPEADRAKIEKLYSQLLDLYPSVAKKLKVAPNDLAGALAAFIAGSWTAYHGKDFKDEYFLPLTQQMRSLVANTAAFKDASLQEKQAVYEQMVIAGVLTASTHEVLKQNPNAQTRASLCETGKNYLRDFFGVDPDRVQIGSAGVRIVE